jgi:signal peptidase I
LPVNGIAQHHDTLFDIGPVSFPSMISLFAEILSEGNDLRIRVTGTSMSPCLRSGDIATIRNVPVGSLKIGDIILCHRDKQTLMLHRLLKIQNRAPVSGVMTLYTKGDAVDRMDSPFQAAQYLGKAILIERIGHHRTVPADMLCRTAAMTNRFRAWYHRLRSVIVAARGHLAKECH